MAKTPIPFERLMIGATLNLLTQAVNHRVVQTLHAQGFTDFRPTFHPVFQWCKTEGSRLTELAELIGVSKPSMKEIIDVLVQLGYLERVPDPRDRRATLIRRTERGWEVNRIARDVVVAVQQEWSQALGTERFAQVLESLRILTRLTYAPNASAGNVPQQEGPPKIR